MWPNPQETADLVTFTEEILNFLYIAFHTNGIFSLFQYILKISENQTLNRFNGLIKNWSVYFSSVAAGSPDGALLKEFFSTYIVKLTILVFQIKKYFFFVLLCQKFLENHIDDNDMRHLIVVTCLVVEFLSCHRTCFHEVSFVSS